HSPPPPPAPATTHTPPPAPPHHVPPTLPARRIHLSRRGPPIPNLAPPLSPHLHRLARGLQVAPRLPLHCLVEGPQDQRRARLQPQVDLGRPVFRGAAPRHPRPTGHGVQDRHGGSLDGEGDPPLHQLLAPRVGHEVVVPALP